MSATSQLDNSIKKGKDTVIFPTIESLRKEPVTLADLGEGLIWLVVCLAGVPVGMALYDWTPTARAIGVGYVVVFLLVAAWITKRQRARGIRRLF